MIIMPRGSERLVPIAFRVTPALSKRIKDFLRDNMGKPHFLTSHAFSEIALSNEIDRLEVKYREGEEDKSPVIRRINAVSLAEPRRTL